MYSKMTQRDFGPLAQKLGQFLTQNPACNQAVRHLNQGVEIGLIIEDTLSTAIYKTTNGVGFETRTAKKPDVVFHLNSLAVEHLCGQTSKNLGELGVEVLKQYVAGNVRIQVTGTLLGIMKNGYLGIIKDAGIPFAKFLAEHGVSNLSKIPSIIKKLRG